MNNILKYHVFISYRVNDNEWLDMIKWLCMVCNHRREKTFTGYLFYFEDESDYVEFQLRFG